VVKDFFGSEGEDWGKGADFGVAEDWGEGDSFGDGAIKGAIGDGIIGEGKGAVSRFACGCGVSGFSLAK